MSKITIHRALSELKLLDARINRAISDLNVAGVKKNSGSLVADTRLTPEQFAAQAQSGMDSVLGLIERRDTIKRAIVQSNATTQVEIGGVKYTVAEAIERKTSIQYDKALYQKLNQAKTGMMRNYNQLQKSMEDALERQLQVMGGADKTAKSEGLLAFAEGYREQNGYEMIDPLGVDGLVTNMRNDIEAFEADVDSVLSESNAVTFIEV